MVPEKLFQQILSERCGSLAAFAYENFLNSGRGLIGLDFPSAQAGPDELEVMYVIYDYSGGKPDAPVASMLRDYDPEQEMIIQFLQPNGQVRTVRVEVPMP